MSMRLMSCVVLLGCAAVPQVPRVEPRFVDAVGKRGRQFVGCWRIESTEPTRRGTRTWIVHARLDTVVARIAGSLVALEGVVYDAGNHPRDRALRSVLPEGSDRLHWFLRADSDSLGIAVGNGMNHLYWQFTNGSDSLVGQVSFYSDNGGAGSASQAVAHRVACPNPVARAA